MKFEEKFLVAFVVFCCVVPAFSHAEDDGDGPGIEFYKQNFILDTFDFVDQPDGRKNEEVKFQFSFKKQAFKSIPLYFGYTQKSFWQIHDGNRSRPFRENNFNPEGFFDFGRKSTGTQYGIQTGIEHESNGRGIEVDENGLRVNKSRSWNRFYLQPKVQFGGHFRTALKVWIRFKEREKRSVDDTKGDDNPDIEEFLGHAELRLFWKNDQDAIYELLTLFRKGRRDDSGTIQLDFIFRPSLLNQGVYFHIHYFNGFGESLIDYNNRVKKAGIGITFGNPFASLLNY